jgi:hypothetical protein
MARGVEVVGYCKKTETDYYGHKVPGVELHLEYESNRITGKGCFKKFISDLQLGGYTPIVGDVIYVQKDGDGRMEHI